MVTTTKGPKTILGKSERNWLVWDRLTKGTAKQGYATLREMTEAGFVSETFARNTLAELQREGLAEKFNAGVFTITETGRQQYLETWRAL